MEKGVAAFRTPDYRVFYAAPYFAVDLPREIRWHEGHLKKLKRQKDKQHLFHRQFTSGPVTEARRRHYEEHVIHSIPFHERFLREHQARLHTMLSIIPKRTYHRLVHISLRHGRIPEYFVYDKRLKKPFFVAERADSQTNGWIADVRKRHLCEVIV
ncbi:MAG: hypothetical protein V1735_04010 [Nanoarchaeota archaeon]